jgi:hypothetical protein
LLDAFAEAVAIAEINESLRIGRFGARKELRDLFLPPRCCLGLFDGCETGLEVPLVLLLNGLPLRIKELKRVRFAEVDKPSKHFGRSARVRLQTNARGEKSAEKSAEGRHRPPNWGTSSR